MWNATGMTHREKPRPASVVWLQTAHATIVAFVEPIAALVKLFAQVAIGLGAIYVFIQALRNPGNDGSVDHVALTTIGKALAISAAVELAYTFFTPSLDEALRPLILGVSAYVLINIDGKAFTANHALPVFLLALSIAVLFFALRFLLTDHTSSTSASGSGAQREFVPPIESRDSSTEGISGRSWILTGLVLMAAARALWRRRPRHAVLVSPRRGGAAGYKSRREGIQSDHS
jgi:hypothetical protein